MLYVIVFINIFSLCLIIVNFELVCFWIRFLKFLYRVREMEKNERQYFILYFDFEKVWVCLKKEEEIYT